MPSYRRANVAGGTYFFTVNTLHRLPVLTEPAMRLALREAIRQTHLLHPLDIDAWVLFPDHLHCIRTLPPSDSNFSILWSKIKRYVSQECSEEFGVKLISASRLRRRESCLWQRRFWEHQIRNDADFARHGDYIYWNPVKHGLVSRAGDWPYSTFHRFESDGVYPPNWGLTAQPNMAMGE